MTKTKIIDNKGLYNFIVGNFSILISLSNEKYGWIIHVSFQNFQMTLDRENDQNRSRRTQPYLQMCNWQFI